MFTVTVSMVNNCIVISCDFGVQLGATSLIFNPGYQVMVTLLGCINIEISNYHAGTLKIGIVHSC